MTMVIRKGNGCAYCGKEVHMQIPNTPVDVYARFPHLKTFEDDPVSQRNFVVEFCSLECFRKFNWNKLKTYQDFLKAHLGKNYGNPAYSHEQ